VLLGFFNSGAINEWRTPNSIAIRLQGRGDVFYAYVEYTTSRWRAGGDSPGGFSQVPDPSNGRMRFKGFPIGAAVHEWSMRYDPNGNGGTGSITVTMDGETSICHLDQGHKADGATFNRFGLLTVMKQYDTGGEVWADDITVDGERETSTAIPNGMHYKTVRTYTSTIVRPRFDFGYSCHTPRRRAWIRRNGRSRLPRRWALSGKDGLLRAPLKELTLRHPLKASGKVSLRRAVTDSDVLFGFFHAEHSLNSGGSDKIGTPPDFFGVSIGGPSREGFMFPCLPFAHDRAEIRRARSLPAPQWQTPRLLHRVHPTERRQAGDDVRAPRCRNRVVVRFPGTREDRSAPQSIRPD
jgi:hypothetical protein